MADQLGWVLLATGVGVTLVGGVVLVREHQKHRQQQLAFAGALGANVRRLGPETPVVAITQAGGMTVEHRRSRNMPIEERVRNIQELIWKSVQDPEMIKLARLMTYAAPERDGEAEARLIYNAVKDRIRYTGDIAPVMMPDGKVEAVDLYQSAARTWEFMGGDCDDHSILNATLLSINGITCKLRVTAATADGEWGHIYVVAELPKFAPKKKVPIDTTLPGRRFGYEVPFARNLDFPV